LWLCACDGLVCRVCASQAGSSFTTRWHEMRTPMLEPSPARSCVGSCRIDRARSGVGFFDRDLAGGDFAQRRDYFFVVRFHQWPRALEQLFGAPRRAEHELEAVGDVCQAIFNGNSCHYQQLSGASRRLSTRPPSCPRAYRAVDGSNRCAAHQCAWATVAGLMNLSVIRSLSPIARYLARSFSPWRKVGGRYHTGWSRRSLGFALISEAPVSLKPACSASRTI